MENPTKIPTGRSAHDEKFICVTMCATVFMMGFDDLLHTVQRFVGFSVVSAKGC